MKQLVVNADDLGAGEDRNAGIFDAIEAGTVTGVSILSNGFALNDALKRIRALNSVSVSFGIHLNLSEGRPVETGLRCIPGPNGLFRGKSETQNLLSRRGDLELEREIRREFAAQIKRILDAGVALDHLDGHQHVHVFPAATIIAVEVAALYGIQWARIPEEFVPECTKETLPLQVVQEAALFSRNAAFARTQYSAAGIRSADHFRGLYFKGELPSGDWTGFLESIPEGITELMVHPGRFSGAAAGPFAGFSDMKRAKELAALTDGRFRAALENTGVRLTRFPDIRN